MKCIVSAHGFSCLHRCACDTWLNHFTRTRTHTIDTFSINSALLCYDVSILQGMIIWLWKRLLQGQIRKRIITSYTTFTSLHLTSQIRIVNLSVEILLMGVCSLVCINDRECCKLSLTNSSWSNDAILWHRSGSTLPPSSTSCLTNHWWGVVAFT